MTEPAIIPAERMNQLTDQLWRRLGLSETFDRLVVRQVASEPGASADLLAQASAGMGAGAAKFFGLTFDKLIDTLTRKEVLQIADGILQLTPAFAERIERAIEDEEQGVSRVEPTPGVTIDDLKRRGVERAQRESSTARGRGATHSRAAAAQAKVARIKSTQPRARRASKDKAEAGPRVATPAARRPTPVRSAMAPPRETPAKELFNSRKLNRLLDSLDAPLFKDQVGRKLELRGADLDRFLEITAAVELVRLVHDDMVELHWRGRELARTRDGDRRMALVGIVQELRDRCDGGAED